MKPYLKQRSRDMTTSAHTDWKEVAALEDAQVSSWITEHGRTSDEGQRREWMNDFMAGTLEQDEDNRSKLMRGFLTSLLTMEDGEAKSYASDFQWDLDHGEGDVAFATIQSLHTGARGLPVEDTMRLGTIWPRVFSRDMGAIV
jgi:hypothetical protein